MRGLILALPLGALMGYVATQRSGLAAGVVVGLCSAAGLYTMHLFARSRVRSRQGKPPELQAGETALLHGPGEWVEEKASAKAWIYLSDRRILVSEEGGDGMTEIGLKDIEELRPIKAGVFSSELSLVARGRGVVRLRLPDAKRWQAAIQGALRTPA